jgi:ADP-ribose pyrophosphatase YjhB (NUDIX family)
MQDNG